MQHGHDVTITSWQDYEITVRIGKITIGRSAGSITSSYEIYRAGRLLAAACVPAVYPTERQAAESALRIAKLDAQESLEGTFPNSLPT